MGIKIFGISMCILLVIIGIIFICKVNKYYDDLIAENEKKYTDHINDWYYEIVEVEE